MNPFQEEKEGNDGNNPFETKETPSKDTEIQQPVTPKRGSSKKFRNDTNNNDKEDEQQPKAPKRRSIKHHLRRTMTTSALLKPRPSSVLEDKRNAVKPPVDISLTETEEGTEGVKEKHFIGKSKTPTLERKNITEAPSDKPSLAYSPSKRSKFLRGISTTNLKKNTIERKKSKRQPPLQVSQVVPSAPPNETQVDSNEPDYSASQGGQIVGRLPLSISYNGIVKEIRKSKKIREPDSAPRVNFAIEFGKADIDTREYSHDMIIQEIESGFFLGPVLRAVYEGNDHEKFLERLDCRIKQHDRDIEKMCNFHYQGFIESITELINVRSDAEKLKAQTLSINRELQESGKEIARKSDDLIQCQIQQCNVASAIEKLSACLPVLQMYSKMCDQMKAGRYYSALKTLEQLEHTYLPRIYTYRFCEVMRENIPKVREQIKEISMSKLKDFLENVRKNSAKIGMVAMKQVEKERNLEQSVVEPIKINGYKNKSEEKPLKETNSKPTKPKNPPKQTKTKKKAPKIPQTISPQHQPRTNPFDDVTDEETSPPIDARNPFDDPNPFLNEHNGALTNNTVEELNPFAEEAVEPTTNSHDVNPFLYTNGEKEYETSESNSIKAEDYERSKDKTTSVAISQPDVMPASQDSYDFTKQQSRNAQNARKLGEVTSAPKRQANNQASNTSIASDNNVSPENNNKSVSASTSKDDNGTNGQIIAADAGTDKNSTTLPVKPPPRRKKKKYVKPLPQSDQTVVPDKLLSIPDKKSTADVISKNLSNEKNVKGKAPVNIERFNNEIDKLATPINRESTSKTMTVVEKTEENAPPANIANGRVDLSTLGSHLYQYEDPKKSPQEVDERPWMKQRHWQCMPKLYLVGSKLNGSKPISHNLSASDLVDFSPVYKCLHIFGLVGSRTQFETYYRQQRRNQARLALEPPATMQDDPELYAHFFHEIVGFFVVEDHILHTAQNLISRQFMDDLWEMTISKLTAVLRSDSGYSSDAVVMMKVKNLIVIFADTLKAYGFSVGRLFGLLMEMRDQYGEILLKRWAQKFKDIFDEDNYTPMLIESDMESQALLSSFPYEDPNYEISVYPRKLPFSRFVPRIYNEMKNFILACLEYCEDLHLSSTEVDDMIRKSTNLLLTRTLASGLKTLVQKPSLGLTELVQIIVNTTHLENSCRHVEDFVHSITGVRVGSAHTAKLVGVSTFKDARNHTEEQIYNKLNSKIDEFFELAEYVWQLKEPLGMASRYLKDLIAFLQHNFEVFTNLPSNVAQTACMSACRHISTSLMELIMDPSVKVITMAALQQFNLDVIQCESFSNSEPVPGFQDGALQMSFVELRQLLDLFLSWDWSSYLADYGNGSSKYLRVNPGTALTLLEKIKEERGHRYIFTSLSKQEREKKRLLETVIKQLRAIVNDGAIHVRVPRKRSRLKSFSKKN